MFHRNRVGVLWIFIRVKIKVFYRCSCITCAKRTCGTINKVKSILSKRVCQAANQQNKCQATFFHEKRFASKVVHNGLFGADICGFPFEPIIFRSQVIIKTTAGAAPQHRQNFSSRYFNLTRELVNPRTCELLFPTHTTTPSTTTPTDPRPPAW